MFALINLSVIIFRESRITSYVPGFRSPFYPWLQIVGVVSSSASSSPSEPSTSPSSLGIVVAAGIWYRLYVRRARRDAGRCTRCSCAWGSCATRASTRSCGASSRSGAPATRTSSTRSSRARRGRPRERELDALFTEVAEVFAQRTGLDHGDVEAQLRETAGEAVVPGTQSAIIYPVELSDATQPEIVLVRVRDGVAAGEPRQFPGQDREDDVDHSDPRSTSRR
jgi:basic amino acid/polyamine antiporter, APA family